MRGKRKSFYVPRRDMWVVRAIEARVRALEQEGLQSSSSKEILKILKDFFNGYKDKNTEEIRGNGGISSESSGP